MPKDHFERLGECDYGISPCCGLCEHAEFSSSIALWGLCKMKHFFSHDQPLNIHRMGKCDNGFKLEPERAAHFLQAYGVFLREEDFWEDLVKNAGVFHIGLRYEHDEDCPENCCWVAESPFLPPDFNPAQMRYEDALKEAVKAIKKYFQESNEKGKSNG